MRAKMSDRTARQTSMPAFTAPRSSGRRQHSKAALAEARAILAETEPNPQPGGFIRIPWYGQYESVAFTRWTEPEVAGALAESLAAFCALEEL